LCCWPGEKNEERAHQQRAAINCVGERKGQGKTSLIWTQKRRAHFSEAERTVKVCCIRMRKRGGGNRSEQKTDFRNYRREKEWERKAGLSKSAQSTAAGPNKNKNFNFERRGADKEGVRRGKSSGKARGESCILGQSGGLGKACRLRSREEDMLLKGKGDKRDQLSSRMKKKLTALR